MNKIFDNYIVNTFDQKQYCPVKLAQFKFNYAKYFPASRDTACCLDIGPGRGEMLRCWKELGYKNAYGIDISREVATFCQNNDLDCRYVEDTEAFLDDNTSQFDFITLCDVLEHIEHDNVIPLIRQLKSALKTGGKILIQVPNMQCQDASLMFYNDFTHCSGFTELCFKQILSCVGFTKWEAYPYEAFCYGGYKELAAKTVRPLIYAFTRLRRLAIGAHSPRILSPVFYILAEK